MKVKPETRKLTFFRFLAAVVLPIWGLGVGYRIRYSERMPQTGAFVLAPNHYTEIDPLVVGVAAWKLGREPRFLAKASLFRIPVVGWVLRKTGQVPVERGGTASHSALRKAEELVAKGAMVIVYPEGSLTRDPNLWPMRGKTGAVRIALERDIPIVPIAHWGAQTILPRYGEKISFFPRKTIDVAIGKPVDLSQYAGRPLDRATLTAATDDLMLEITALLAELRAVEPPDERWDPTAHGQKETGRVED